MGLNKYLEPLLINLQRVFMLWFVLIIIYELIYIDWMGIMDELEKTVPATQQNEMDWQTKRMLNDQKRVDKWEKKQAQGTTLTMATSTTKEGGRGIGFKMLDDLTLEQNVALQSAIFCETTGASSYMFGAMLLNQTLNAVFKDGLGVEGCAEAINNELLALQPQDAFEGMLITRMIAVHNQAMTFMSRSASPTQTMDGIDININRATKLFRLWNESMEALNRYRRKGEQKVTVQHVNVSNGGQAVVNGQYQGGGVHDEK